MPTYRVNTDGVAHARKLMDAGKVDVDTEWPDAEPTAAAENELLDHLDANRSS